MLQHEHKEFKLGIPNPWKHLKNAEVVPEENPQTRRYLQCGHVTHLSEIRSIQQPITLCLELYTYG